MTSLDAASSWPTSYAPPAALGSDAIAVGALGKGDDDELKTLIQSFSGPQRLKLGFPSELEELFEVSTAQQRSWRMWRDGMVAILIWAACLLSDVAFLHDRQWLRAIGIVATTLPVALLANEIVRRNPSRKVREGSIAVAVATMATVDGWALSPLGSVGYAYGLLVSVVCASFAVLVIRLRFRYSMFVVAFVTVQVTMLLASCHGTAFPVRLVGCSIAFLCTGILAAVAYLLEHEERLVFLLRERERRHSERLVALNARLIESAQTDFLTGLPNRRLLMARLRSIWDVYGQGTQTIAAVMVDVDYFKQINDNYGHVYGDKVLTRVAMLLRSSLRQASDVATRYGGEEFVLLLPNTSRQEAERVAERVRSLVEQAGSPPHEGVGYQEAMRLTVSCGVACCTPLDCSDGEQLVAAADAALYAAKRQGRNQVVVA